MNDAEIVAAARETQHRTQLCTVSLKQSSRDVIRVWRLTVVDLGIKGKVALVCASTSGLGKAVAKSLAYEGARVVVSGHQPNRLQSTVDEVPGSVGVLADYVERGAARKLFEEVTNTVGRPEILILNGPGPVPLDALEVNRDQIDGAVETLVHFHVELTNLVLPHMKDINWGRIVAIGSSGIIEPIAGLALSNMFRSALASYLKTLATEVASQGITVNLVVPGRISTERTETIDLSRATKEDITLDGVRNRALELIPIKRYGEPEEFAAVVCFLCGIQAAYVTGSMLRCDGGLIRST